MFALRSNTQFPQTKSEKQQRQKFSCTTLTIFQEPCPCTALKILLLPESQEDSRAKDSMDFSPSPGLSPP
jgi:hypothetical protein